MADNDHEQPQDEKIDYRTLSDGVLLKIRDAILSGRFKPGERLEQGELAERFGTSRMPVRDALRRLEGEGLVRVLPGRGAFVCFLDLEEFRDVYEVRATLEDLAACKAAPESSDEDIANLTRLVEAMEEAYRSGDLGRYLQLDLEFHNASYRPCRNPVLLKAIAGYWNSTQHYRRAFCRIPGRIEKTQKEHRQLLEAIYARDGALFGSLMRKHIKETIRAVLAALETGDLSQESFTMESTGNAAKSRPRFDSPYSGP